MDVLLSSSTSSTMAVGVRPTDAIQAVLEITDLTNVTVEEVSAKPLGGPETFGMTRDFVRETGYFIPGMSSDMLDEVELDGEFQVWMVTVNTICKKRWEYKGKPVPQPTRPALVPNDPPQGNGPGPDGPVIE